MRMVTCAALAIVVLATPLLAQEEAVEERDFGAAVRSQELQEQIELYRQMGRDEGEATLFAMMASGDMHASQMMMLMMMMDGGGGGGGDAMGMFMLMNAMGQSKGVAQPVVIDRGETLLIVEGGVLYKINPETMELEGQLAYAKKSGGMADILPWLMMARAEAAQDEVAHAQEPIDTCRSNLKQLSLGFMMYIEDFGQVLPGEDWAQTTQPYLKNVQILTCPSRPELEVGYAMNEKLLEAEVGRIRNVSRTIMLFESNIGGESPIGGPEALPDEPIHGDQIVVAFVDGHVENVSLDEARELLERDPFE